MIGYQNFFSTALAAGITATDTTIILNALPTPSEGYLVMEPDSSGNREIIYYTSKTSTAVICPDVATGRGVGGTSARSHSINATVKMNIVAEHFSTLQNGSALNSAIITPNKLALIPGYNKVAASETRTSSSYGDLATAGPSATVTVGANGIVLVLFSASINNSASGNFSQVGIDVSGANTIAAGADPVNVLSFKSESGAGDKQFSQFAYFFGLTAGSTVFKLQYATTGGTATFSSRKITAIPL